MFHAPNKYRVRTGAYASPDSYGNSGAFRVPIGTRYATVICSDGEGWEHVSASFKDRCPTWDEMCKIKDLFWDAEDCVVQYHPPRSEYVNDFPYCLHLWRPTNQDMPRPPAWTVGRKMTADSRRTTQNSLRGRIDQC
jgi:hypothetical protein